LKTKPDAVTLAPGSLAACCAKSGCAQTKDIEEAHKLSAISERRGNLNFIMSFQ
jgi:hypothetical protein